MSPTTAEAAAPFGLGLPVAAAALEEPEVPEDKDEEPPVCPTPFTIDVTV